MQRNTAPPGTAVAVLATGDVDTVTIRVLNQGSVIPEESIEAIFAPLIQLQADRQDDPRPNNSLRIGLFVAREIASDYDGNVTVKSDAQTGTEFTILLPRTTPPVQPAQA